MKGEVKELFISYFKVGSIKRASGFMKGDKENEKEKRRIRIHL